MKPLKILILLAAFVLVSGRAAAQFSVSKSTSKETGVKLLQDSTIKEIATVKNPFFSEARHRAELKKLRKDRNTFSTTIGLNLNQTGFDNWAGGGLNTFSGIASLNIGYGYKRDKFSTNVSLGSQYGMNVISGKAFKNVDFFNLNVTSGRDFSKNWAYTASGQLNSQWTKGYVSADNKTMISNIMSPGTLNLGLGLSYKTFSKIIKDPNNPGFYPLKMTINPISGNILFVLSDTLSRMGVAGITPGDHHKTTLGSNIRIEYRQSFAKSKMNYTLLFMGYTNYDENNTVDWHNTLTFQLTRIINLTFFCRMMYNELQKTPRGKKLQWNYSGGIGFSYTFKSK